MAETKTSILAIGAHAGDVEVTMGLALAHHANLGRKLAICHLTLGENGHPDIAAEQYINQKRDEALAAAEMLGAELYILPFQDGQLKTNDEITFAVCDVIRDCKPDVILTHWKKSAQNDHIICNQCVPNAMFYAGISAVERMSPPHQVKSLYYAENWEDCGDFLPELYIEITEDDIALWEKLVKKYSIFRGNTLKFPYVDYYKALAERRGKEVRAQYATAFSIPLNGRRKHPFHQ